MVFIFTSKSLLKTKQAAVTLQIGPSHAKEMDKNKF